MFSFLLPLFSCCMLLVFTASLRRRVLREGPTSAQLSFPSSHPVHLFLLLFFFFLSVFFLRAFLLPRTVLTYYRALQKRKKDTRERQRSSLSSFFLSSGRRERTSDQSPLLLQFLFPLCWLSRLLFFSFLRLRALLRVWCSSCLAERCNEEIFLFRCLLKVRLLPSMRITRVNGWSRKAEAERGLFVLGCPSNTRTRKWIFFFLSASIQGRRTAVSLRGGRGRRLFQKERLKESSRER